MPASKLQGFIQRYGPIAGPRLYHALQSRAAYIGANSRRRKTIAGLTGVAVAAKRPDAPDLTPALPYGEPVPLDGSTR